MYPAILGLLLALCGLIVLGSAIRRTAAPAAPIRIDVRGLLLISAGILIFAYLINVIGLVGSTFVLMIMANLAIGSINIIRALVLAAFMSAVAVLIFDVGLNIPLQTFRWPL